MTTAEKPDVLQTTECREICFLNTEKVPLGECRAVSETAEMLIFLMALNLA